MPNYLISNVSVADTASAHNGEVLDILWQDGSIAAMGTDLAAGDATVIDGTNQYVSPSWIDTFADFCYPGYEHRERIDTALSAAEHGGFGTVLVLPNTRPSLSNASQVANAAQMLHHNKVQVRILGAATQNIEGRELAEMLDMQHAGAIAFTDGWQPIQDPLLLQQALQYLKTKDAVLMQLPIHQQLNVGGLMNEGASSVRLGVPGMPAMAEELMVRRDIALARYTHGRLHIVGVSTAKALEQIAAAKNEGLRITCSVAPYQLLWTDEMLGDYDSQYKLNPPLRTATDRAALVAGLTNGTIDCICSLHQPHNWDEKEQELDYAAYGLAGIQQVWPLLLAAAPAVSVMQWLELLVYRPAKIFGLKPATLNVNSKGTFTLFNKERKYTITAQNKKSHAYNVPFLNKEIVGSARVI